MPRLSADQRRQQIVQAAAEIIIEKGLGGAATRDVTRKLHVGSGLLHHYFPSWNALRAEAVQVFVHDELDQLERLLDDTDVDSLVDTLTDWMADDPAYRHWGLWLDATQEARRDPQMARTIKDANQKWHAALVGVITRLDGNGPGQCPDPDAAAWRLSALIDGLAWIVIAGNPLGDAGQIKRLVKQQFALELHLPLETFT